MINQLKTKIPNKYLKDKNVENAVELFKLLDINNDGVLDRREIQILLKACNEDEDDFEAITDSVFKDIDLNDDGIISFEEYLIANRKQPVESKFINLVKKYKHKDLPCSIVIINLENGKFQEYTIYNDTWSTVYDISNNVKKVFKEHNILHGPLISYVKAHNKSA